MAFTISTDNVVIARVAGALYAYQLGNASMTSILASSAAVGANSVLNSVVARDAVNYSWTPAAIASTVVTNLGINTPAQITEATAYIEGQLAAVTPAQYGQTLATILGMFSGLTSNAFYGTFATNYNNAVAAAVSLSQTAGATDKASFSTAPATSGGTYVLTPGFDSLTGTAFDDVFVGRVINNANTAQSADKIDGGAGTDRLSIDIGNSQAFAITLDTTSVEAVSIRAQTTPVDTNNNNMANAQVQIDAQRMSGVNYWENSNSRSDLVVEDVRILSNQITKDITVAMVETDPGNVDFGLYFDQLSLRNASASTSQLNLQVMDTRAVVDGLAPLLNSPYGGFRFTATNTATGVATVITLQSQAIDDAQTYAQLATAFQAALDAQFGAGAVTATESTSFTVTDTTTATLVTGKEIKISTAGAYTFTTPTGSGWIANGVVPANSGLHTNFNTAQSTSTDPVTVKVIVDDVGRGSTGGDLVIGGLSVGDTSTSQGVQRFEIEVRDNSKLQTINSTNNSLKEVTIVNGLTTSQSNAYVTTVTNAGNLTVNGKVDSNEGGDNTALPGTTLQHNAYGFSDVRLIDASAMTGKLEFNAEFSQRAVAKYLNLVDTAAPTADNIAVVYTGGAGNDTMVVDLDKSAIASNSSINVGREDFTFAFNGGAGDDSINVAIDRTGTVLLGNAEVWYTNQVINKNITIDGGDGNDTIRTPGAGNMTINGGAGNDTFYTDNTGAQAGIAGLDTTGAAAAGLTSKGVFVFNTAVQTADDVSQNLYNLLGTSRTSTGSYGSKAVVTFMGLKAEAKLQDTTDYKVSDLEVNQAIKAAVNGDAVLSKLLLATDGPNGTLIVTSLIDGVLTTGDLTVALVAPTAADLNTTVLAAYKAVNTASVATDTTMLAAEIAANLAAAAFNANRYTTQTADDTGGVDIVGANSVSTSDNTITPGVGNDVIVLGTTAGATVEASSNETIVYAAGAFGNDTIVNFTVGALATGGDVLKLAALGGNALGAINTDKAIVIVAETVANDTAAEIAALYTDGIAATTSVYVAYDATTNAAKLYSVVDPATVGGAGVVTATFVGSIDLADVAWTTITAANVA